MNLVIAGIPMVVRRKRIKNMYLRVQPLTDEVVISAPLRLDEAVIAAFARTHLDFIRRAQEKFRSQPRAAKRQYVSGETLYIWGKPYDLLFRADVRHNGFSIQGQQVILSMRAESTVAQRQAYVREQYRQLLKEELSKRLPLWEKKTGLYCQEWRTKYMRTRWGTCNVVKKRIWFNVQLAEKPLQCLDYIILHELSHFVSCRHDAVFKAHLDKYMPAWRDIRRELNERQLDYYEI